MDEKLLTRATPPKNLSKYFMDFASSAWPGSSSTILTLTPNGDLATVSILQLIHY